MNRSNWPGVKALAEALPQIVARVSELTEQEWTLESEETRGFGVMTRSDGLALQLSVDSFNRPKKIVVQTLWRNSGIDAWANCIFAANLVTRGVDPAASINLSWSIERIAKDIAARVISPAENYWPAVQEALAAIEVTREAHDAYIQDVAELLAQHHIRATPDGYSSLASLTGKTRWGTRWKLSIDPRGATRLEAVFLSRDALRILAPALAQLVEPGPKSAAPPEPADAE